jgi:hypothetical protein
MTQAFIKGIQYYSLLILIQLERIFRAQMGSDDKTTVLTFELNLTDLKILAYKIQ